MTRKPRNPNAAPSLSSQQTVALWLFASGNPISGIAKLMFIAEPTVKEHLFRAYRALNARNGVHAVHIAYQNGIFSIHPKAGQDQDQVSDDAEEQSDAKARRARVGAVTAQVARPYGGRTAPKVDQAFLEGSRND